MANKKEEKPIDKSIDYSITHKEAIFSDQVKLAVKEDAFLLSFMQTHPASDELICVAEIILPPKVAASLGTILVSNALRYQDKYDRKIMPANVKVEEKKPGNKSGE